MCCCTGRPVRVLLMVAVAEIWRERPQEEQNMACALLAAPHRSQKRVDESAMHLFFLCLDGVLWVRVGCRLVHLYVICQGGILGGFVGKDWCFWAMYGACLGLDGFAIRGVVPNMGCAWACSLEFSTSLFPGFVVRCVMPNRAVSRRRCCTD